MIYFIFCPLISHNVYESCHLVLLVVRKLTATNVEITEHRLKTKIASYERKEQAEKIASIAVQRGIMAEDEAPEYAEHLASGGEDLKLVEEVVGRTSRALPLGKMLEKSASADNGNIPVGEDVLTNFLLSSDFVK